LFYHRVKSLPTLICYSFQPVLAILCHKAHAPATLGGYCFPTSSWLSILLVSLLSPCPPSVLRNSTHLSKPAGIPPFSPSISLPDKNVIASVSVMSLQYVVVILCHLFSFLCFLFKLI
jgi:hypothetical protein